MPIRAGAPLAVSLLAVLSLPPARVAAATTVLRMSGAGRVTPGLTSVPTDQTVAWTFLLAVGAGTEAGTVIASGCVFNGSGSGETLVSGAGSGKFGDCAAGSVSGTLDYVRVLGRTTWTGHLTVNGARHTLRGKSSVQLPLGHNDLCVEIYTTSSPLSHDQVCIQSTD